ncbi:MAG: hypothetical protein JJT88_01190 [Gammaproteobacteria bacterium]|nr:hypothetical protein [Gammaproteobacteria bacterium]
MLFMVLHSCYLIMEHGNASIEGSVVGAFRLDRNASHKVRREAGRAMDGAQQLDGAQRSL